MNAYRVLNNRKYLDAATYGILAKVLETLMEIPDNTQWLLHTGTKGGSTVWILTKALYATTKKNMRIELTYFFNNHTPKENSMLQVWMNSF